MEKEKRVEKKTPTPQKINEEKEKILFESSGNHSSIFLNEWVFFWDLQP